MEKRRIIFKETLCKIIISLIVVATMYVFIPIITNIDFTNVSYAATYGDYEYKIKNDGTVEITKYIGKARGERKNNVIVYIGNGEDVIIPKKINGKIVSVIGENAFSLCSNLNSVTIPDSVTSIGNNAFQSCTDLKSIIIPNSVISIGNNAFQSCIELESIQIPNNVTSIGDAAFYGCSKLSEVTISNSVTNIGNIAFSGCNKLQKINVSVENSKYSSTDGVLFNKNKTKLIQCPGGKNNKYVIPNSVTSIGKYAFDNCINLTSIVIPNTVTTIEDSAFGSCENITSITIPSSVKSIGYGSFFGCDNLNSITISEGVNDIGQQAFSYCNKLTHLTIPSSVINIGSAAFAHCENLISITISAGVTNIDPSAFSYCKKLKSVTIPNSVTSLENYTFNNCENLSSVTLSNNLQRIGTKTFNECKNLKRIVIPDSVEYIDEEAFSGCKGLTSILLPDSLKIIEEKAFSGCENLTSIVIPKGVERIDENVFENVKGPIKYYRSDAMMNYIRNDSNKERFIRLDKPKISAIKKISNTGKTISNNNSTTNYIKNSSELKFKLVFGETLDVSGVDTSKIKLSGANSKLEIDSVNETECNFTIKGGTGNGKINITINEGFLTDEFGNKSAKSTAIEKLNIVQDNTAPTVIASYDEENNKMNFEITDVSKITKYKFKILDENNNETWVGRENTCSKAQTSPSLKVSKYKKVSVYVEDILGNNKTYTINPYVKSSIKLVKREGNVVTYRIKTNKKTQIYSPKIQQIQVPNGCEVTSLTKEDSTSKRFLLTIDTKESNKSGNIIIPKGTIYAYNTNDSREAEVEIYMDNNNPIISLSNIPTKKQQQVNLSFYLMDSDSGVKKYRIERLDANGEVQKVLRTKKVSTTNIVKGYVDSINILANGRIRLTVWDNQDNITEKFLDIENIDRTRPKAQVTYSKPNENGKVSVTIVADEKVTITTNENIPANGWINISNNVKQKLYNESDLTGIGTKDNLFLVDEAGNKKTIKITDKIAPSVVNISQEVSNGSTNVTVQLSEKIKLTDSLTQAGWTLSEDKYYLNKTVTENEEIVVTDLAGNNSELIKIEVEEENGQIQKLYKSKKYEPSGANTPTETVIKYLYLNRAIESVDLMNLNGKVECELLDENKTVKLTFKQNVETNEKIKLIENDNYFEQISIAKVTNIVIKGDSNDDGTVTDEDRIILKRVYLGKIEEDDERKIFAMDMDNDGIIDKNDYLELCNKLKEEGV